MFCLKYCKVWNLILLERMVVFSILWYGMLLVCLWKVKVFLLCLMKFGLIWWVLKYIVSVRKLLIFLLNIVRWMMGLLKIGMCVFILMSWWIMMFFSYNFCSKLFVIFIVNEDEWCFLFKFVLWSMFLGYCYY